MAIDAVVDSPAHCSLCGRKTPKCKWCFKGGLGDPPMPEMASWNVWRKGLERVLRSELKRAGIDACDEQRTIEAVLFDRGDVPESAIGVAFPYMRRPCSEGRYNDMRSTALLTRRIHLELRRAYIPVDNEPFIARIERLRRLTRDELIAQAKRDEVEKQRVQVLSWHLEDLACIAVMTAELLRIEGVTPEQRALSEIVQMVVDRVGIDASTRVQRAHWERIARGLVADELRKRRARVRVKLMPRLRVAAEFVALDQNEQDILADEDARASAEADEYGARKARAT